MFRNPRPFHEDCTGDDRSSAEAPYDAANVLRLTRTVRFAVGAQVGRVGDGISNSYAGAPAMAGLGAHYELDIACRGEADPVTGYFLNIKEIDHAARDVAIPLIAEAFQDREAKAERVLSGVVAALASTLPNLDCVRWRLTPTFSLEMERPNMTAVLLRQKFEFAAAHRLHVPELSDDQNRDVFGKCNNPAGHGHNYHVEPCVSAPVSDGAPAFSLHDLERITRETLIDHLDHKHLNKDVPEFADLNPSVENIARVCYERLKPAIAAEGAELREITVWETEKTSCVYPA